MIRLTNIFLLLAGIFFGLACNSYDNINYKGKELIVASWNVENLFDTIDDWNKNDGEFTPTGKKEWTEDRLNVKIENLAEVIKSMNPDLMGFQEVEHVSLLEMLLVKLSLEDNYSIVYAESPDGRGIDNGLIYNNSIFNLIDMDTIKVELTSGYPTRYILYSALKVYDKDTLHIFVNHWPSRSGGEEKSEAHRINAASRLRGFIEELHVKYSNPKIVIMGDFNDEPANKSISIELGAKNNLDSLYNQGENRLYNMAYDEFINGGGSYLYRGDWNMLDQIIISKALISTDRIRYLPDSFRVVKPEFMVTPDGDYKGSPMRSYGGNKYLGGYSDHFPVLAKFIFN